MDLSASRYISLKHTPFEGGMGESHSIKKSLDRIATLEPLTTEGSQSIGHFAESNLPSKPCSMWFASSDSLSSLACTPKNWMASLACWDRRALDVVVNQTPGPWWNLLAILTELGQKTKSNPSKATKISHTSIWSPPCPMFTMKCLAGASVHAISRRPPTWSAWACACPPHC